MTMAFFSRQRKEEGHLFLIRTEWVAIPAACLSFGLHTAEKMLMPHVPIRELHELASLYGVQPAYQDVRGDRQPATPEALLAMLQLLGAPVATFDDVPSALQNSQRTQWQRAMEPVVVAWEGSATAVSLRLPVAWAEARVRVHLKLETGENQRLAFDLKPLSTLASADVAGQGFVVKQIVFPGPLPRGYHQVNLDLGYDQCEAMLIVAPRHAFHHPANTRTEHVAQTHGWGVFMPLYALYSQDSWGIGDLSDLQRLVSWTAELGGHVVATLPLLSTFLDRPYDPSPYAPASRLFWNELFIDVSRIPEFERHESARSQVNSPDIQAEINALRAATHVDYRRTMALKREVLETLSRRFFAEPGDRDEAFQGFLHAYPKVSDYARFRAVGERQGKSWSDWPTPLRDGVVTERDYDRHSYHYHLYVQWIAHEQMLATIGHCHIQGIDLYLDLPLGVHGDSYDVWRERDVFLLGAAAGAPPDTFFTKGQNWGFPPLHPEAIRTQHYRYVLAYLRHQLAHAGWLRIDHVMGLHRLFCIPQGFEARDGVYVHYPAEELYAITCLESHRHQTRIVGENLGTVPDAVNTAMTQHQLHCMYVVQYALCADEAQPLPTVSSQAVASLNTHDMPPFAAFWKGLDLEDLLQLGLYDEAGKTVADQHRKALKHALARYVLKRDVGQADTQLEDRDILVACLRYLAASAAPIVIVNLEDLWGEEMPQNVPGTGMERPNWQRKAALGLEAFGHMAQVTELLRALGEWR
jgi:4-alpha-glucanotransferase